MPETEIFVSPAITATRIVVLDNRREGVLVPGIYDPALNPGIGRFSLRHSPATAN